MNLIVKRHPLPLGNGHWQFHGLYILKDLIKALFKLNSSSRLTLTTK